jgi:hypothetical protein
MTLTAKCRSRLQDLIQPTETFKVNRLEKIHRISCTSQGMPPRQILRVAEGGGFARACMTSRARAEGGQSVREEGQTCR